ncbi:unnamed protein product [Blepharisma stoltei]|uniref:Uncharacterized protein n=1 Tax=Blepharisma stoltei TaxID=1481888 RepID=A0AAU9INW3_9CILI|nr:unnamed protein product [Blepharisma stoltei]
MCSWRRKMRFKLVTIIVLNNYRLYFLFDLQKCEILKEAVKNDSKRMKLYDTQTILWDELRKSMKRSL